LAPWSFCFFFFRFASVRCEPMKDQIKCSIFIQSRFSTGVDGPTQAGNREQIARQADGRPSWPLWRGPLVLATVVGRQKRRPARASELPPDDRSTIKKRTLCRGAFPAAISSGRGGRPHPRRKEDRGLWSPADRQPNSVRVTSDAGRNETPGDPCSAFDMTWEKKRSRHLWPWWAAIFPPRDAVGRPFSKAVRSVGCPRSARQRTNMCSPERRRNGLGTRAIVVAGTADAVLMWWKIGSQGSLTKDISASVGRDVRHRHFQAGDQSDIDIDEEGREGRPREVSDHRRKKGALETGNFVVGSRPICVAAYAFRVQAGIQLCSGGQGQGKK